MLDKILQQIFSDSARHIIETMSMTKVVEIGEWSLKSCCLTYGAVTGVIGMVGEGASGTLTLSFDPDCLREILFNMLGEENIDIDGQGVSDAVGEFTNIICGDIKRRLMECGVEIGMATPFVVCGEHAKVRDRVTRETYIVYLSTAKGKFTVETNLILPPGKAISPPPDRSNSTQLNEIDDLLKQHGQ